MPGITAEIVIKQGQRTEKLMRSVVKDVLTKFPYHPHGIKVRLQTGIVNKVGEVVNEGREGAIFSGRDFVDRLTFHIYSLCYSRGWALASSRSRP